MEKVSKKFPGLTLLVLLVLTSACSTSRYVGSIGRDGMYSNRGFGLLVRLSDGGLRERWEAIDPTNPDRAPARFRPVKKNESLDLDADGFLNVTERVEHLRPTLRLLSRTSSAASITIDVTILGGKKKNASLDSLTNSIVGRLLATTSSTAKAEDHPVRHVKLAPNFDARMLEVEAKDLRGERVVHRLALIHQTNFLAEEGIERNQVVRVELVIPTMTDRMRQDLDLVLKHLVLNRRASAESSKEKW